VQVALIAAIVGALSGFMNNVGALELLLPIVQQMAKRSGRLPRSLLMPLSFGSLLGGMVTMIDTPPNIIVTVYRTDAEVHTPLVEVKTALPTPEDLRESRVEAKGASSA
jgi:Na+/H+ antiporter NhaD/arsenite permease-like protein